jgi:hypothetical protein
VAVKAAASAAAVVTAASAAAVAMVAAMAVAIATNQLLPITKKDLRILFLLLNVSNAVFEHLFFPCSPS